MVKYSYNITAEAVTMLPNKQCMKDILKYVSENSKVQVTDMAYHNIKLDSLNVTLLLAEMPSEGKYTIEDIAYNFLQCYNNGLIDAKINYQSSNLIQSTTSDIYGITFRGIDFMNQD